MKHPQQQQEHEADELKHQYEGKDQPGYHEDQQQEDGGIQGASYYYREEEEGRPFEGDSMMMGDGRPGGAYPRDDYSYAASSSYPPPRMMQPQTPPQPCSVIGVFGLSGYTRERQLEDVFAAYGSIERINLVFDSRTQKSRGFAFISYASEGEATRAKEACNGLTIDGRQIRVDYSRTPRAHDPSPGQYLGQGQPLRRPGMMMPPPRTYRDDFGGERRRFYPRGASFHGPAPPPQQVGMLPRGGRSYGGPMRRPMMPPSAADEGFYGEEEEQGMMMGEDEGRRPVPPPFCGDRGYPPQASGSFPRRFPPGPPSYGPPRRGGYGGPGNGNFYPRRRDFYPPQHQQQRPFYARDGPPYPPQRHQPREGQDFSGAQDDFYSGGQVSGPRSPPTQAERALPSTAPAHSPRPDSNVNEQEHQ